MLPELSLILFFDCSLRKKEKNALHVLPNPLTKRKFLFFDRLSSTELPGIKMVKYLNALHVGEKAIVKETGEEGDYRMLELGFVKGAEVTLIRKAPFGDPIEILVQDYRISLRKSDAAHILVETHEK